MLACPAAAQEITVTARSGGLELTGRYLGFDGDYLRMATEQGELTLDYAAVDCAGAACPDPDGFVPVLRFSGTSRLAELILPALVEGYARDVGLPAEREARDGRVVYRLGKGDGVLEVALRSTTTEDGIADLLASEADVALAAREVTADEARLAEDAGLGRLGAGEQVRVLALDALVPVAAPAREIEAITLEQLAAAYAGEIRDWAEIGGTAGPIGLHLGPEEAGQAQGFVERFLVATGRSLSPDVIRHADTDALVAAVAADGGALGLVPFGETGNARVVPLRGPCGLGAVARAETVKTEDYPLTTPLFLYLPERRLHPAAQEFLTWLSSEEAQLVLRRAGVLGQEAVAIPLAEQGERLAAAIEAAGPEIGLRDLQRVVRFMRGRERLSLTFRFDAGETTLDGPSRSNLLLLAERIAEGRYRGRELTLAGFSDGEGPAAANLVLSRARAEEVRAALLDLLGGALPAGTEVATRAFGEVLPIGCDGTPWGRQANRRVELWASEDRP